MPAPVHAAPMSLTGFYACLRNACAEAGGQSEWAARHGVSPAYVSDVLCARRDPGPKILTPLGLKRAVMFIPLEARKACQ